MKLSLIVAVAENGVIGRQGTMLPWKLSADLARFKQITMGHPIIMGRKTYQSIGRALPGRLNIVITGNSDFQAPSCSVVRSMEQALRIASDSNPEEVFVIGGAMIFQEALPLASAIQLTLVHGSPEGDVYFRYQPADWRETGRQDYPADDKNEYPYSFIQLSRSLLH